MKEKIKEWKAQHPKMATAMDVGKEVGKVVLKIGAVLFIGYKIGGIVTEINNTNSQLPEPEKAQAPALPASDSVEIDPNLFNLECDEELASIPTAETKRAYMKPTDPIPYHSFPRKLPEGQHHSEAKVAEAEACGYTLPDNETWVTEFTKGKLDKSE